MCVRLSDEAVVALEAHAARKGLDRSAWLREVVLARLELPRGSGEVEAMTPPPPQMVEPMVPGDRIRPLDPASVVE